MSAMDIPVFEPRADAGRLEIVGVPIVFLACAGENDIENDGQLTRHGKCQTAELAEWIAARQPGNTCVLHVRDVAAAESADLVATRLRVFERASTVPLLDPDNLGDGDRQARLLISMTPRHCKSVILITRCTMIAPIVGALLVNDGWSGYYRLGMSPIFGPGCGLRLDRRTGTVLRLVP